jgi:hypothetical protein
MRLSESLTAGMSVPPRSNSRILGVPVASLVGPVGAGSIRPVLRGNHGALEKHGFDSTAHSVEATVARPIPDGTRVSVSSLCVLAALIREKRSIDLLREQRNIALHHSAMREVLPPVRHHTRHSPYLRNRLLLAQVK